MGIWFNAYMYVLGYLHQVATQYRLFAVENIQQEYGSHSEYSNCLDCMAKQPQV